MRNSAMDLAAFFISSITITNVTRLVFVLQSLVEVGLHLKFKCYFSFS